MRTTRVRKMSAIAVSKEHLAWLQNLSKTVGLNLSELTGELFERMTKQDSKEFTMMLKTARLQKELVRVKRELASLQPERNGIPGGTDVLYATGEGRYSSAK